MLRGDVFAWLGDGEVRRMSSGTGIHMQACVHPTGRHAVFWGADGGLPRVWRAELDTASPLPAEPVGPIGARHPSYGNVGDRVVFAVDEAGTEPVEITFAVTAAGTPRSGTHLNLWTMAPDGSDVRQLTDGPFQDQRPCVSPDGATVVFVSDRAPAGLWTLRLDGGEGSGLQPLRPDGLNAYRPWFSLDGASLFFFTLGRRRQVHRLDLTDFGDPTPQPLANDDAGNTHGPFADPGGESLLVHSDRGGGVWGLWELPLDGTPMRPVVPPGMDGQACGHPTRATNGVLCFDAGRTTMGRSPA